MIGNAILSAMFGDPTDQISRTLNPGGPNPNPGAQPPPGGAPGALGGTPTPGAQGGPSGAPSTGPPQPQPPLAPAAATQSPPDLASLYVQLHQRDEAAHSIDQGTALMASAFGTAQQQHDMMQYAQGMPQQDSAGVLGGILKDQKAQKEQQDLNRFQAGAAGLSRLLGVTPEQAQTLVLNPDAFNEVMRTHQTIEAQKANPTETMKNADAETKLWAAANPDATPQEIAAHHASILTGMIPGPAQEAAKNQAVESQKFKDNAMEDYGSLGDKLSTSEGLVKKLLDDMPSTMAALRDPDFFTKGMGAALPNWSPIGASQGTKDAAATMDQLRSGLSGDNLSNVKNVRNRMEFQTLSNAVNGAFTPGASEALVRSRLEDIQKKFLDAHATNEMAAGHHLTGNLVGHGQSDLLSPTLPNGQKNPFYNGATSDPLPQKQQGGGGGKTYTYNPKTGQLE